MCVFVDGYVISLLFICCHFITDPNVVSYADDLLPFENEVTET